MNIGELLNKGTAIFNNRPTPLLDAEILLAHTLGVEKEYLVMHREEEVEPGLVGLYETYLGQVAGGEPVAYITKEKEFFGLNFYVDKRVLIPRPETEHLVEAVLDYMRKVCEELGPRRFRIVDVGTGSGNIAIALARSFEEEEGMIDTIDAVDFSEEAVEVARINVEQQGVQDLVCVTQSDLLDFVEAGTKYDVIVANLPYIGRVRNRFVSREAEKYEPDMALFGGEGGLELYKKMFEQIAAKKIEFKLLLGEFGFAQTEELEAILNKYFEGKWQIEKDYAGIDRMFTVKM